MNNKEWMPPAEGSMPKVRDEENGRSDLLFLRVMDGVSKEERTVVGTYDFHNEKFLIYNKEYGADDEIPKTMSVIGWHHLPPLPKATFIHAGDLHFNKARAPKVLEVLDSIIAECASRDLIGWPCVDAVLIGGDFWDSTVTNTRASGFVSVIQKIKDLSRLTKVFMLYGTPSHEPEGSLDIFRYLSDNVIILGRDELGIEDRTEYRPSFTRCQTARGNSVEIVAIPEPRLSLTEGNSTEEKYANIQRSYMDIAGRCRSEPKESTRIVLLHGLIHGAILDNGMSVPKGETAIEREVLDGMNADIVLCAHIHRKQKVEGMRTPCYYCGSMPPKNFGETHEASYIRMETY